ncbi:mitotic-spindle organizing protein 2 isoform X1 [Myxocyprinus asiaticus]|uniref:mitotic-spindle organizing protein 2 isoform X1 n=1 Tax=Myxocyprinus asiaticus TaxID=70543 RepID=UPI002221B772|nr:mitotic-spindle organizing protein 2 isoform X1 [Myxocyprinus asiaticus]XP_051533768.1 mitotic-spindle organizing protein 2 isoform X1 [Myxocyprinus asiaticus]
MSQSAQTGTMPTAPDSPSLSVTVSGNVQKYGIKKKKVLNAEETELFELTQAAGIIIDQEVFKIIVDLLKMNVAPLAVFQTLKTMFAGQKVSETSTADTSTASHTTTAPSESREEECVVSAKSTKTAAPPSASAPRPPRGGAKIVVYSSGDTSAQVRSKTSSGQGEKTARDGSSQRVPRQVSATRGQKSAKSSGSSSSSSQLTSN